MENRIKINDRLKITVIGCGQCGCQITSMIEQTVNRLDGNRENVAFVGINTSQEDLSSVSLSHKIWIEGSKGAAGQRKRSIEELARGIDEILEELESHIVPDSIIFIATSLGGGTGSAIAPTLAEILLESGYDVGMILVLPSDTEPLKIRDNARQAFNEVDQLKPRMGSIFILDNNSMNKILINQIFASLFTGILCINNRSIDGNMDLAEIEECLKCPSFSIIAKLNGEKGTTANFIDIIDRNNNVFAKRDDKTITIMGISEASSAKNSQIDIVELRKGIGMAPTEFHGYMSESGENVVILSGLNMPYSRIDSMTELIKKEASIIQSAERATTTVREVSAFDLFRSKPDTQTTEKKNSGSTLSTVEKLKAMRISK